MILASLAAFMVLIAFYFLPYVAYYQLQDAIVMKDVGKLSFYTNLHEMRRNLKAQKGQRVIKGLERSNDEDPSLVDLSIAWSALSMDQDIDRAISTEGFYTTLYGLNSRKSEPQKTMPKLSPYQFVGKLLADASFEYRSLSKFVISFRDEKGRYVGYFSFVFEREGLNWKLTNILLPVF